MGAGASVRKKYIQDDQVLEMCKGRAPGTCPVCLEWKEDLVVGACGHALCAAAVPKIKNTCPLCRGEFSGMPTATEVVEHILEVLEESGF